jgi:hypothetical protein
MAMLGRELSAPRAADLADGAVEFYSPREHQPANKVGCY